MVTLGSALSQGERLQRAPAAQVPNPFAPKQLVLPRPKCRCIPVRFLNRPESANDVEVCMITTTNGKGLVFPKVCMA